MNSSLSPSESTHSAARRSFIEERMRHSTLWQVIHILGSLKLALLLLAILAIACAIATFTEANFNTKIAQATIYKAPWFIFWLALLCINLFAVTLTRWPWQRKHIGFVITHYGIISLLVGALIGSTWGFEGNVILRSDASPIKNVTTNRNVIQVESPADGSIYRMFFDPEVTRPSPTRLRRFSVPGSSLTIITNDMSTSLRNEPVLMPSKLPSAPAGVLLELSSSVVPNPIRIPLLLDSKNAQNEFFGLAKIHFLSQLPDRSPHVISETRMVFNHHPPIIQAPEGSTGWVVELNGIHLALTDPVTHKSQTLQVMNLLGHSVKIGSSTLYVDAFWPDFEMRAGKPVSASPLPRNPAVLVRIVGPVAQNTSTIPLLEIAPNQNDPQHPLRYQLSRGGVVYAEGKLAKEVPFATGWADWNAKLLDFYPSASLTSRLIPSLVGSSGSSNGGGGAPPGGITGFQAFLQSPDGTLGPMEWIGPGIVTTLFHRDGFVRMTYGLEVQPLPFSVRLNNFEVPRYEGTTTPSDYISTLSFQDPRTNIHKHAVAKMNHPANIPGGLWASMTGFNYKFSQAQWNPADLRETTLQVLYDPGWFFKWVGSLGICIGITMMFYFTPKRP